MAAELEATDKAAAAAFADGKHADGLAALDGHALRVSAAATAAWAALWQQLVVTFVDGRITKPDPTNQARAAPPRAALRAPKTLPLRAPRRAA
eukprot:2239571-Prymnesium_polylepis.1